MKKVIALLFLMLILTACGGGGGGNNSGGSSSNPGVISQFSMSASKTTLTISETNGDSSSITIDGSNVDLSVQVDDPTVVATMNGNMLTISPAQNTKKQTVNIKVTGSSEGITKTLSFIVKVVNSVANKAVEKANWIDLSKDRLVGFEQEKTLFEELSDLSFKAGLLAKKDNEALKAKFSVAVNNENAAMLQAITAVKAASDDYRKELIGATEFQAIYSEEVNKLDESIARVLSIVNEQATTTGIIPIIKPVKIADMDVVNAYSQFTGNPNVGSYVEGNWMYNEQYRSIDAIFSPETCAIN